MQDRYVGDIGDFAKYGLLRALSAGESLGIAWYLYPDESHNTDGRHIGYLEEPEKWRHLDPELFDGLAEMVGAGKRSIRAIEESGWLGSAKFSGTFLDFTGNKGQQRVRWFQDVTRDLNHCSLIFADPDNGLCEDNKFSPSRKLDWKRLPLEEALRLTANRTGIFYHHNSRFPGGHLKEIYFWREKLGSDCLALYWRRFSNRTFFITNPAETIKERVRWFADKWSPHFDIVLPEYEKQNRKEKSTRLKACPECGHVFSGTGWGGIDAHWKSQHEHIMAYKDAWPLIKAGEKPSDIRKNKSTT